MKIDPYCWWQKDSRISVDFSNVNIVHKFEAFYSMALFYAVDWNGAINL